MEKPRAMRRVAFVLQLIWVALACSSGEVESDAAGSPRPEGNQSSGATDTASAPESMVEALSPVIVTFTDPETGFMTPDVHDATREIVRFDAARGAMVSAATGDSVSGWMTDGNDLGPSRSFRVRFGSEGGEPRAYFTETGNGTICNIVLSGPEQLQIFGTSERPPRN
jgi:hypothetical protein